MAGIRRFEELETWKKARGLTAMVYALTSSGDFSRDFALRDQIRRAAVSVMSNIAEGFERGGDKEFHQFLAIAKGSIGEIRSQLYVALDAKIIRREQFEGLFMEAEEISRMLAGMMKYLKSSLQKGSKFK